MINQMITYQVIAVIIAQVLSFLFNVAETHFSLLIITIQQAQSTQFRTLKLKVNLISISILSSLSDIKNSVKLKEIFNMKFTDSIFHE